MLQRFLAVLGCLLFLSAAASAAPERAQIERAVINTTTLQPGQQAVVAIIVNIADGFHAQSHTPIGEGNIPFTAKLNDNPALTAYDAIFPPGQTETYKVGTLNVYTGRVVVYIPFQVSASQKPAPIKLSGTVGWQICDDNACYMPEKKPFTIETTIVPPGQPVKGQEAGLFKNFDPKVFSRLKRAATQPAAPATQPVGAASSGDPTFWGLKITHNSYWLAFLAAFVAGIMFNAVPCVLPVVPLKAMGFYEVSQHNRLRCVAYGAVFSAGLVASFGALALIVLVGHKGWGQLYSNPWFNLAIVLVLLIFAIGTFGFFTVNVPTFLYSIAPRHDTYFGNFLFGILTAILSTPCTFGLFLGLLVWAADQPPAIGIGLVMTVGVGMAFPYFLLSMFPEVARNLPRSGPWAELVKQEMAFLLLGSAIFFARRFIQPALGAEGFWWLLFAVAVCAAAFLLVRTVQLSDHFQPRAVAALLAFAVVLCALAVALRIVNQPYAWTPFSPKLLADARDQHRVVVVEFTATWCTNCQYVETHTLHSPPIVQAVKRHDVQMLKADVTAEDAAGWTLLKAINPVAAIPFTAVYGPGTNEPIKLEGIYSADDLRAAIDRAANAAPSASARMNNNAAKRPPTI
jgi:thiol:disulfide interchange protein DsbD